MVCVRPCMCAHYVCMYACVCVSLDNLVLAVRTQLPILESLV